MRKNGSQRREKALQGVLALEKNCEGGTSPLPEEERILKQYSYII